MSVELAGADGGYGAPGIDTTSDPLRAEEALAWFEQRVPVRKTQWHALEDQARRRAFTVAGVTSLDVLNDVWSAIDRAIADGTTFEDFQKQVGESLTESWGRADGGRLETVFRTNVQAAYGAGRWSQLTDPEVVEDRPYLEFVAILDASTTPGCHALEGTVRPTTDSLWTREQPPRHFNCRSTLISLTVEQAGARHMTAIPPHEPALTGFGGIPNLAAWSPNSNDYPPQLFRAFQDWQARR